MRTAHAVTAYAWTREEVFLDAAGDGIGLLLAMPTWCWAAHERFAAARSEVVPDPARPYLDLGAAETVSLLAWCDFIIGDELDARAPGLRRRLRAGLDARGFAPFLDCHEWEWIGTGARPVNNWNAWICGQILTACLLVVDDDHRRSAIARTAMERLDVFIASIPADGGIDEGFAYWWEGPARLLEGARALDEASHGVLGIAGHPPLQESGWFPVRMRWSRDWFVNPADGPARPEGHLPWHIPHHWARRTNDQELARISAEQRDRSRPVGELRDSQGIGRALVALFDEDWAGLPTGMPRSAPPSTNLPDTQIVVAHAPSGLSYALKGGHNAESHNHLDIGAVSIALDGIPCIIDLGAPTYTARTFSDRRYEEWVTQTRWHSCPTPWGTEQGIGREYAANAWTVSSATGGLRASLDVARAYALPQLRSWVRTVSYNHNGTSLELRDEATAKPEHPADDVGGTPLMTTRLILAGTVTLEDACAVVGGAQDPDGDPALDVSGPWCDLPVPSRCDREPRRLRLSWDGRTVSASLERRTMTDPRLARVWGGSIARLTLTCTTPTLRVTAAPA